MTYIEFMNKYCLLCGNRCCTDIYDKINREGCDHYQREFGYKFVTCKVCNGSGVDPNHNQCRTCYGFGTVIIYEEQEDDRC